MAHLKDLVVDGDARIIGNLYSSNGGGGGTDLNVIFDKVYPVGSIYMSVSPTNPGELFCGTWVAWGSGQVPVGVKTTDTDFATVEKTGGAKTASTNYTPAGKNTGGSVGNHTLTVNEMPSHNHPAYIDVNFSAASTGNINPWKQNLVNPAGGEIGNSQYHNNSVGGGGAHNHPFTQPTFTGTQASITESTIQPYITCYMWKRTA